MTIDRLERHVLRAGYLARLNGTCRCRTHVEDQRVLGCAHLAKQFLHADPRHPQRLSEAPSLLPFERDVDEQQNCEPARAIRSKSLTRSNAYLICLSKIIPTPSPLPAQSAAPTRSKYMGKRCQPIRVAPASGGAIVESPGKNLAKTIALTPQRSKRDWVCPTQ